MVDSRVHLGKVRGKIRGLFMVAGGRDGGSNWLWMRVTIGVPFMRSPMVERG